MRTTVKENKYIQIIDNGIFGQKKTHSYEIVNKADLWYGIGHIEWYPSWRQYCFMPAICLNVDGDRDDGTVWNSACLELIMKFLKEINTEHRKSWNQKKED